PSACTSTHHHLSYRYVLQPSLHQRHLHPFPTRRSSDLIHSAESEIMRNNALINLNMIDAAARKGIKRYFFSSSVCIYRDMRPGEPELKEAEAYPALPDNEYGWEKLYAERVALAYGRKHGMDVRIARFQNCYGPEGTWTGGREKAPAAICRKVAEAADGDTIEVWGDGKAIR